jgi:hypothetical protein
MYRISAAQRVSGPATALIVTAILGMCLQALTILHSVILMIMGPAMRHHVHNGFPVQFRDGFPMMLGAQVNMATGIFGLAMGTLILIGAIKMKNLNNYVFAMAATIIALLPCISPCCLGIPFGIWALIVLCDSSVKAAFKS